MLTLIQLIISLFAMAYALIIFEGLAALSWLPKGVIAMFKSIGITTLIVWIIGLILTVQGLMLAFSTSMLVGVVVLIVEPLPLIIGLFYLCTGTDLSQKILQFIS